MKKIVAFNGSPRKNGNTSNLLNSFEKGVKLHTGTYKEYFVQDYNLHYCKGCLRCNLLGYCSIQDDDWKDISKQIRDADVLVFATPIYFHHVSAQLKTLIDRFRSFIKVEITEKGLNHIPRERWNKDFVLITTMGSSDDRDAEPVIELFRYLTSILGEENGLHVIKATRLAVSNQINKSVDGLKKLYPKLNLSAELADHDHEKNMQILDNCFQLGKKLSLE